MDLEKEAEEQEVPICLALVDHATTVQEVVSISRFVNFMLFYQAVHF